MNCTFHLNESNLWQCTQCGWVYPRAADKPPRRNCPKAPDAPKRIARTRRDTVLATYDQQQLTDPPRAEIERRLDVCEACDQYAGALGHEIVKTVFEFVFHIHLVNDLIMECVVGIIRFQI